MNPGKSVLEFIWSWLSQVEYPQAPDMDGSIHKGWLMEYIGWSCIRVKAEWGEYGK